MPSKTKRWSGIKLPSKSQLLYGSAVVSLLGIAQTISTSAAAMMPQTARSSTAAHTPLKVAVVGGFSPTFVSLVPSLSQQLQQPIEVTSLPIAALKAQLHLPKFDLIVTGAPSQLSQLDYLDQLQLSSLTVIAHSPVILWCPNPNIQMRVRLQDTLKNPRIKTIALSPVGSPVGDLVRQQLPLPAHIKITAAAHSLEAWQLAQQGKVDCAFSLIGLTRPNDQYQFVPHRGVKIIAAIPKTNSNPSSAISLLKLLERPLFRARIQHYGYS